MSGRSVEEYLQMPYTLEIIRDANPENPGWVARVVELPGCMTQADTFAGLGEMIEDAMRSWIQTAIEDGDPIPEPKRDEEYSGKFIVRLPKSLHRHLALAAEREEISLNQFVSTTLANALVSPAARSQSGPAISAEAVRSWIKDAVQQGFREANLVPQPEKHKAEDAGPIARGLWHREDVLESSWYYYRILEAYANLANTLPDDEKVQEFKEIALKNTLELAVDSIENAPENPIPRLMHARVLLRANDFTAALQAAEIGLSLAEKIARTVQDHVESYYPYWSLDADLTRAQKENDPIPGLLLAKVDALTGLGRFEDAIEVLKQAQSRYPDEIIYYRYAATLLVKMDRLKDALLQFKAARKAKVKLDKSSQDLEKKIKVALAGEK